MTGCADKSMLLHALIDGELDAANSVVIETHLKSCAGCAAELRRLEDVRRLLVQAELRYTAPQTLREKIMRDAETAQPVSAQPLKRRIIAPWIISGGITALAASLILLVVLPQIAATHIEDQVVDDHVRSLFGNRLVDVASSDRQVVKPWFKDKINFVPPVIELADKGFPLEGGRLDYLDGHTVPALVYHRHTHNINVFVRPAQELVSPGEVAIRRDGYSIVRWSHGGLECWAVSDLSLDDMKLFRSNFEARIT